MTPQLRKLYQRVEWFAVDAAVDRRRARRQVHRAHRIARKATVNLVRRGRYDDERMKRIRKALAATFLEICVGVPASVASGWVR